MHSNRSIRVIKAVIFDFDGVLVESAHIKTEAFRKLFSPWSDKTQEIVEYHIHNAGISRYVKFKNIFENILHEPYSEGKGVELGKEFSAIVLDEIKKATFVRGAREFLDDYHNEYTFFIASGTPQIELNEIVHCRGINKYFRGVFGTPATKLEIVNDILKKNGWDKGAVAFIGDAESDKNAAEETGIHFVLRRTPENRHIATPNIIEDLTELKGKLAELDSCAHTAGV